jgi:hypothetical protein
MGAWVHRSGQRAPEWRWNSFGSHKQKSGKRCCIQSGFLRQIWLAFNGVRCWNAPREEDSTIACSVARRRAPRLHHGRPDTGRRRRRHRVRGQQREQKPLRRAAAATVAGVQAFGAARVPRLSGLLRFCQHHATAASRRRVALRQPRPRPEPDPCRGTPSDSGSEGS